MRIVLFESRTFFTGLFSLLICGVSFSEWNPFPNPTSRPQGHMNNPAPVPLVLSASDQVAGDAFWLDIHVGDSTIPVDSLYGLSLAILFETGIMHPTGLIEPGAFIGNSSDVRILDPIVSDDTLFTAITRIDTGNTVISGTGNVLRIQFESDTLASDAVTCFEIVQSKAVESDWSEIPLDPSDVCIFLTGWLTVWPGDTDNNGDVDQADLLPIGLSWGRSGHARFASLDPIQWEGVLCPPWDGRDEYTYADADGDGSVDEEDILPIGCFWHCRQDQPCDTTYDPAQTSKSIPASIHGSFSQRASEDEIELILEVEEVSQLLGGAFRIEYPSDLFEITFVHSGELMKEAPLLFYRDIPEQNLVVLSVCRSRLQGGVSGAGSLFRIRFRKISDIGSPQCRMRKAVGMDQSGNRFLFEVDDMECRQISQPIQFELFQNYPNPFNSNTIINYHINSVSDVSIVVFDINGKSVRTLLNRRHQSGRYRVSWDGSNDQGNDVAGGLYFYRIRCDGQETIKKAMYLK